ncbi:hypothetical protein C8Q77DRAFT_1075974 [Trametes polyzona]|nr:hypothetical protein C8Q77DRAFT_1075974 [Trametes polyzona]
MNLSSSSTRSHSTGYAFMKRVDLTAIRDLALQTRYAQLPQPPSTELSCAVVTPPMTGTYNAVFELRFSDGVSWAIRMPTAETWRAVDARNMELDVVAIEFIASHTSVPIPHIHAYCCDADNPVRHPFVITDKVRGVQLCEVWYKPSWWTGARSKQNFFESLAGYMSDLASFEFNRIGRLDRVGPEGPYNVVAFPEPDLQDLGDDEDDKPQEFGPFASTHAYLTALLALRRKRGRGPWATSSCSLLRLFIGALPDEQFDGAPFILGHPDFDAQNIFVDEETGRVVDIIDWDGVAVMPRQLGALQYPAWLTMDWNPDMFDNYLNCPGHDTEEDLRMYRRMYVDAVREASGGRLEAATRNSHVAMTVHLALGSTSLMPTLLHRLGEYTFGEEDTYYDVLEGLESGGWHTRLPDEPAEVKTQSRPEDTLSVSDHVWIGTLESKANFTGSGLSILEKGVEIVESN